MSAEWLLFAGLCLFWLAYLVRPFRSRATDPGVDERRRLIEAKRGYLYALRDAEVDHESGKLSEADYVAVRDRLEEKAAETMRLLDELGGGPPEARIERMLADLRARRGGEREASAAADRGAEHA